MTPLKLSLWALGAWGAASLAVAAPELYTIEPMHTYPSFAASHQGISFWRGKFTKTRGKIWLDREKGTGKVDITIDANSVDFGLPIMDKVAQGETLFNVEKYPTVTYKADSMTFKDGVPIKIHGELTLLGVTKPVPLEVASFKCKMHPFLKREVCGAEARGEFNRTQFGMTREAEHDPKVSLIIDVEALKGEGVPPPPAGPPPGGMPPGGSMPGGPPPGAAPPGAP